MRLRNKKTGEIASKIDVSQDEESIWVFGRKPECYRSLAELNEEWEDYELKEPLIKDKKIRKAVRAWAEANYIDENGHNDCLVEFDHGEHRLKWIETSIEFNEIKGLEDLEDGKEYTITELCGEEEE